MPPISWLNRIGDSTYIFDGVDDQVPLTCASHAFRGGDGLIHLAPGEPASATWGVAPKLPV